MSFKILVTGAAGYLGSVLCRHLTEAGNSVIALDEKLPCAESNISACGNMEWVKGDVLDAALLKQLITKTDILMPLAALVGAPKCDQNPDRAWKTNFEAIQLLNTLRSKNQRVIYPMTNNGYLPGLGAASADEETSWHEGSLYTKSKKQAEELLLESGNAVSLRLASLFGVSPHMRWDLLVHTFVGQAVTQKRIDLFEENFKRSFLHVSDAADAFCFFAESRVTGIFNVALPSANISKLDLAKKVQVILPETQVSHAEQFQKDPDARDFFISTAKIQRLGFEPKRSLEEGISELTAKLSNESLVLER